MSQPSTDPALLERARAGDRAALEALLARYQGTILRFAQGMCRQPEDAEGVLQETMIAVARSIGEFRGASSLPTWMYRIARSFCIKKRRRARIGAGTRDPLEPGAEPEAPDRSPEEAAAGRELDAALAAAIAALDPRYREILLLRDVEGLTAPEVAEVTGLSVAGVKTRLHRARAQVRDAVAPWLDVPTAPIRPDCPDVVTTFSRYVEGELGPTQCAAMIAHLEGCPRCAGTCDGLRKVLAHCEAVAAPEVPISVQAAIRDAVRAVVEPGESKRIAPR